MSRLCQMPLDGSVGVVAPFWNAASWTVSPAFSRRSRRTLPQFTSDVDVDAV
jgi:hypothetical protein